MLGPIARNRVALPLAALMLAAAFAGCASSDGGGDGGDGAPSFEAAMNGPGRIYDPKDHNQPTDVHLKLLTPADADNAAEGKQEIEFVLFDAITQEPITDADFEIDSQMPAMGHGTSDETAPVHQGDGIYLGHTNHVMPGDWDVHLRFERSTTGESFEIVVPYTVNQG